MKKRPDKLCLSDAVSWKKKLLARRCACFVIIFVAAASCVVELRAFGSKEKRLELKLTCRAVDGMRFTFLRDEGREGITGITSRRIQPLPLFFFSTYFASFRLRSFYSSPFITGRTPQRGRSVHHPWLHLVFHLLFFLSFSPINDQSVNQPLGGVKREGG